jgi:hypothetical protein
MSRMQQIDPILFELAELQLNDSAEKLAFVPSADPAAGGDPAAMDPSMGGMPPAGAAPPSTAGGGAPPPFDPSAMMPMIQQAVQQAMGGGAAGGNPAAPGGGPVGVGAKLKIDPTMVYLKLGRLEKLMLHMYEQLGWPIPPDTLNDDAMIQAATGMPASPSPAGDPAAGGAPAGGPAGMPALPGTPAVNPIQPMDLSGGQAKTGGIQHRFAEDLAAGAAALEMILN